jgi:vitamin B12 transporter
VRIFSTYAVRENLLLKLRVENALDEEYEEVLGYASLPRGIFGGVEWRF